MKQILALALALAGCAPMYRPHLIRSPMLDGPEDRHIAADLSLSGVQLAYATSPVQGLGVRGDLQGDMVAGPYGLASAGVGHVRAAAGGFRLGLWLDGGAGAGSATLSTSITTASGTTTSTTRLAGPLLQLGGTAELGWEGRALATGLELRAVEHLVFHSARSDQDGVGHLTSAEALGFLRVGKGIVAGRGFLGLSLPLYGNGKTGVQLPLVLGLGLVMGPAPGMGASAGAGME